MQKLIMFGDSITQGWTGSFTTQYTIAYWIANQLNIQVDNHGYGGGRIVGDRVNDLMTNINDVDLTQYDSCSIAYGINDFDDGSIDLNTIITALNNCLDAIYKQNPKINVYGITPLPAWVNVDNQNTEKGSRFTENELIDAEIDAYLKRGIPVLDWRLNPIITHDNYKTMLGDGQLHPSESTYELLGKRIAEWIVNPPTPVQLWQSAKYHMAAHKERQAWWDEWGAKLRFMISNDGDNWVQLPSAMDINGRDPYVLDSNGTYFIVTTGPCYKTTDFINFEDTHFFDNIHSHHWFCWAPEFFKDKNGNIRVVYSGSQSGDNIWNMNLYTQGFDTVKGLDENEIQLTGDFKSYSSIDPDITYYNGKYRLFYVDNSNSASIINYAESDNYAGPYTIIDSNINADEGSLMYEGPELMLTADKRRLYLDPFNDGTSADTWHSAGHLGICYKPISGYGFTNYGSRAQISDINVTPFQIRHMGFMENSSMFFDAIDTISLVDTINTNLKNGYNEIKSIQTILEDNHTIDEPQLISDNQLGLNLYQQISGLFPKVQLDLVKIEQMAKSSGVTDDNGYPYVSPSLSVPKGLAVDSVYLSVINENFSMISKFLHQIEQRIS